MLLPLGPLTSLSDKHQRKVSHSPCLGHIQSQAFELANSKLKEDPPSPQLPDSLRHVVGGPSGSLALRAVQLGLKSAHTLSTRLMGVAGGLPG